MIIGFDAEEPELELPPVWLWDIIDEFINQFQSFHQYRSRVSALSADDCMLLLFSFSLSNCNYMLLTILICLN
jgi:hypothetical protein